MLPFLAQSVETDTEYRKGSRDSHEITCIVWSCSSKECAIFAGAHGIRGRMNTKRDKASQTYTLAELAEPIKFPIATNLSLVLGPEIPHVALLFFLGLKGLFRPNRLTVIVCCTLFCIRILLRLCELVMLVHRVPLEVTFGELVGAFVGETREIESSRPPPAAFGVERPTLSRLVLANFSVDHQVESSLERAELKLLLALSSRTVARLPGLLNGSGLFRFIAIKHLVHRNAYLLDALSVLISEFFLSLVNVILVSVLRSKIEELLVHQLPTEILKVR